MKVLRNLKYLLVLPLLAILIALSGLGKKAPDDGSPKSLHSGEIAFDYPRDWWITTDIELEGFHQIIVEAVGKAMVILHSDAVDESDDVLADAKTFSADAATETPFGEVSKSVFEELPESGGYQRVRENFGISVLGKSVPHQRIYASRVFGERRVFLVFQAAVEDLGKVEAGFELILRTLNSATTDPE